MGPLYGAILPQYPIIKREHAVLLFPVDRDTYEIFYRLQSSVFDAASLFQTNHVVH